GADAATAWTPESKPVIFTELGCPAIDKGANQLCRRADRGRGRCRGHRPHHVGARGDRGIAPAYFAYAVEAQGEIKLRSRRAAPVEREFALDDLIDAPRGSGGRDGGGRFAKRRAQESELPAIVKLTYGEPVRSKRAGSRARWP